MVIKEPAGGADSFLSYVTAKCWGDHHIHHHQANRQRQRQRQGQRQLLINQAVWAEAFSSSVTATSLRENHYDHPTS